MVAQRAVRLFDRQSWLEPVDTALQRGVTATLNAFGPMRQRVQDTLNGTWLGHPLHPVMTDVAIGGWTTAAALDMIDAATGHETYGPAADASIVLGLAGATGAALTGLADWQFLYGQPRRVGLVHGLLNVSAVGLYLASLALRRSGSRGAGRGVAALAYGVMLGSAYLGGDLVYKYRSPVNHAGTETMPRRYTPVMLAADLEEGTLTKVDAKGTPVLLVRRGERIYALAETCCHLGGPLSEGELRDDSVICPWHGSRFALEDGAVINGPATMRQPHFETRIQEGQIQVRLARD